jgi:hypothetical protein
MTRDAKRVIKLWYMEKSLLDLLSKIGRDYFNLDGYKYATEEGTEYEPSNANS